MEPLEVPKRRPLQGYEYTPKQQAEKEFIVGEWAKKYPQTPELWIDWMYDFCFHTPQEELDRIMESGEWDKPSKFNAKNYNDIFKQCLNSSPAETSSSTHPM